MRDRAAVFSLALEQTKRYPGLRKDVDKIHNAVTEVIGNAKHFAQVVDVDGKVEGAMLCITADALWAQRNNCNIALWVSNVPGGGVKLLRDFTKWVKSGRSIKLAGMCPDLELDGRAYKILERAGFEKHGGSYLLYN